MKMRARKRLAVASLKKTVKVDLLLDADVVNALKQLYPRGINAGILDAMLTHARKRRS